jgi:(S)-sulfolactate dehydrogenase
MPTIVISEFIDEGAIGSNFVGFDVLYDPGLVDRRAELIAALADARALIVRNRTTVDAGLLAQAPRLEAVGRLGVGLDNIDVAVCAARGIPVYPATGANDAAVVEYVIAAMLILLRGAYAATDAVLSGAWPRTQLFGREAGGKQLGLIGFGAIGRKVGACASALGMTVCAYDPHVAVGDPVWSQPWGKVASLDLDTLLQVSDVVSLHVPLTDATRNMLDSARLARMKADAILINAARGGVIDEAALAAALRARQLGGAALDVFLEEPLSKARAQVFADCLHLLLTPHIAGLTVESNVRVSQMVAEKVRDRLAGGR